MLRKTPPFKERRAQRRTEKRNNIRTDKSEERQKVTTEERKSLKSERTEKFCWFSCWCCCWYCACVKCFSKICEKPFENVLCLTNAFNHIMCLGQITAKPSFLNTFFAQKWNHYSFTVSRPGGRRREKLILRKHTVSLYSTKANILWMY